MLRFVQINIKSQQTYVKVVLQRPYQVSLGGMLNERRNAGKSVTGQLKTLEYFHQVKVQQVTISLRR